MYNAMMTYHFKPEFVKEGIAKWKKDIATIICDQPGFIRVQLYSNSNGTVVAIGSWNEQANAEAFMRKGVFSTLLKDLDEMMVQLPQGTNYHLDVFEEATKKD